jgi:cytochrome c-type biogenesis protein CcmF
MLPLAALLCVGIHANWKRGRLGDASRTILLTLLGAAVLGCAITFGIYAHGHVLTPVATTIGVWIILSSLVEPLYRWRRRLSLPRALVGMTIAHMGLGVAVIALTTVQSFTVERDVSLAVGESASVGGYTLRFNGVRPVEGPNYEGIAGAFTVSRGGKPVAVMVPQKRQFWVQHQVTSETAIRLDHGNNLLLALGEDLGAGRWSVRVQVRPLVSLVWLAALIMAIGAATAASDRRYRTGRAAAAATTAVAERA